MGIERLRKRGSQSTVYCSVVVGGEGKSILPLKGKVRLPLDMVLFQYCLFFNSIKCSVCIKVNVQECPGTSYLLQRWIRRKWIIDILVLQISCFYRHITQKNESSIILEFKFENGIQIGKSNEADFTFQFDLIFHSWSFSSCLHVMLPSRLFCYVTILPKSVYLAFRTLTVGNNILRAHLGPVTGILAQSNRVPPSVAPTIEASVGDTAKRAGPYQFVTPVNCKCHLHRRIRQRRSVAVHPCAQLRLPGVSDRSIR